MSMKPPHFKITNPSNQFKITGNGRVCMARTYEPVPPIDPLFYDCEMVIALGSRYDIRVIRDDAIRDVGSVDLKVGIDRIAEMLSKAKFGNSMDMFREGMKLKLIEVITDVITDKNIVLKGEEDENSV